MGRSMPGQSAKKRFTRRRAVRPRQDEATCDTAQVLSSVAQGLAQAQQQAAAPSAEQEILRVLQQIEQHLAAEKNSGANGGTTADGSGNAPLPGAANGRPNMLRQLLAALQTRASGQQNQGGASNSAMNAGPSQGGSGVGQGQGGSIGAGQGQDGGQGQSGGTIGGQGQGSAQAQGGGMGGGQNQGGTGDVPLDPQTAAQLLSQAQYELANELEASLQKLRQVINESEKIAAKVSALLQQQEQQQ